MQLANLQFKMWKGCRGATHQGAIRGPPTESLFRRNPVKGPGPPTSRVGPHRLIRVKAEAWLPAARAKSGPRMPGHWTGAEGALAADARDRLEWLGPFTHAKQLSESCPSREALGVRCLEDRSALLGLGVRGMARYRGARTAGARSRLGSGWYSRGPELDCGLPRPGTRVPGPALVTSGIGHGRRDEGPGGNRSGAVDVPRRSPGPTARERPHTRGRPTLGGGARFVRGAAGPSEYLGL